jgi:anti-sigma factor RsiW
MNHVYNKTAAWLAGELEPTEKRDFEQHVASCPSCAREAEEARRVWNHVEEGPAPVASPYSVWPGVQARTTRRDRSAGDWFFGRGPWTRRGWAACAVAAGLSMGMVLPGLWTGGTDEADPVDPRLAESSWLADGQDTDLATWWLAANYDEEDGS